MGWFRREKKPLRVAVLVPKLYPAGGVERWIDAMQSGLPPDRVVITQVLDSVGAPLDRDVDAAIAWNLPRWSDLYPDWRKPVVAVAHGDNEWTTAMLRKMWPGCTHCVAVSKRALSAIPPEIPATVIHNGIDMRRASADRSPAEMRRIWGVPPQCKVLGYLGRYSPEKFPLAAALAAKAGGTKYFAVLVVPHNTQRLAKAELDLDPGHYTIAPQNDNWGEVMGAFDVYFCCSFTEGFGLSTVEAWSSGTPVVATPNGIIPEMEERFGRLTVQVALNAHRDHLRLAADIALSEDNRSVVGLARRVAQEHLTAAKSGERWAHYLEYICGRRKDPVV